jgi:hypothetical protein
MRIIFENEALILENYTGILAEKCMILDTYEENKEEL